MGRELHSSLRPRENVLRRSTARRVEVHLVGFSSPKELASVQVREERVHVQRANDELKNTELEAVGERQHLRAQMSAWVEPYARLATYEGEFQERNKGGPQTGVHCADDQAIYKVPRSHKVCVALLEQQMHHRDGDGDVDERRG